MANLHYKSLKAIPAEQWEAVLGDCVALTQVSTTLEMLSVAPRRTVNEQTDLQIPKWLVIELDTDPMQGPKLATLGAEKEKLTVLLYRFITAVDHYISIRPEVLTVVRMMMTSTMMMMFWILALCRFMGRIYMAPKPRTTLSSIFILHLNPILKLYFGHI